LAGFLAYFLADVDSRGRQLGLGDHVVSWPKPPRPKWMDAASYAALPDWLEVREVQVTVATPGFRVRQFIAATTLLDATRYSAAEVADLYHQRWHVEMSHPHYPPSDSLYRGRLAA
jgi:hypothetical protein